jgi:hypothetical protein
MFEINPPGLVPIKFIADHIKMYNVMETLKLLKLLFWGEGFNSSRSFDFHGKAFEPNHVEK